MSIVYDRSYINRTAEYVTRLYITQQTPALVYHNLEHTERVVEHTWEIAGNYSLNETGLFILSAAAWFHDCGHLSGPARDHENRSVTIMKSFMIGLNVEEDILLSIEQCICATQFPYQPISLLGEIICDADSYHLGTEYFTVSDELVKREFILRNNFIPSDWDSKTLSILETHIFFTDYCRSLLNEGKQRNIQYQWSKIKKY